MSAQKLGSILENLLLKIGLSKYSENESSYFSKRLSSFRHSKMSLHIKTFNHSRICHFANSQNTKIILSTFCLAVNEIILNPVCVKFTTQITIIYLIMYNKVDAISKIFQLKQKEVCRQSF